MVAIVSKKGCLFKGLINYLYKGRLKDRGAIDKQSVVITHSDNIRIPYGEEDEIGRKRLISDFIDQSKSHRNYGDRKTKYVGEHILSFTAQEVERLGKEKIKTLCEEYIIEAGFDKTQYMAVSHGDTDIFHIHIVFNRCQNDKTLYSSWKEKLKATERAIAITLKYGLSLSGNQERLADTKGVWEARAKHEDIVDLAQEPLLKNIRNYKHLEKVCEANNIPLLEESGCIKIGGKSFKKRDLDTVFFMNRQKKLTESHQTKKNNYTPRYARPKNHKLPNHKVKKIKYENNQDERENKRLVCKSVEEQSTNTIISMDENQEFNYRKAWGKNDKEDDFYNKRRKKR